MRKNRYLKNGKFSTLSQMEASEWFNDVHGSEHSTEKIGCYTHIKQIECRKCILYYDASYDSNKGCGDILKNLLMNEFPSLSTAFNAKIKFNI